MEQYLETAGQAAMELGFIKDGTFTPEDPRLAGSVSKLAALEKMHGRKRAKQGALAGAGAGALGACLAADAGGGMGVFTVLFGVPVLLLSAGGMALVQRCAPRAPPPACRLEVPS